MPQTILGTANGLIFFSLGTPVDFCVVVSAVVFRVWQLGEFFSILAVTFHFDRNCIDSAKNMYYESYIFNASLKPINHTTMNTLKQTNTLSINRLCYI